MKLWNFYPFVRLEKDTMDEENLWIRRGIIQPWVYQLGLRQQGVLFSAVRGCDSKLKDDPSKIVIEYLRGAFLLAHCGDNTKASSFIRVPVDNIEFRNYTEQFLKSLDQYPVHFIVHLAGAISVLSYYHPTAQKEWLNFYTSLCRKLHFNPQSKEQLEARLNANEDDFRKNNE